MLLQRQGLASLFAVWRRCRIFVVLELGQLLRGTFCAIVEAFQLTNV